MNVTVSDRISSAEAQRNFMARYVKAGDSVIDVGANVGAFTVTLADMVGKQGSVVAIEPNVAVFKELAIPGTLPSRDWIIPLYAAAGAKEGWKTLWFDPRGPGGTLVVEPEPGVQGDIQVLMLDRIRCLTRPVAFIKIDAEGSDIDVLRGARKLLAKDRPIVMFEWHPEAMRQLGKDPADEKVALEGVIFDDDYVLCDLADVPIRMIEPLLVGDYALIPEEKI